MEPPGLADARRMLEQGLTGAARARLEALAAAHPTDTETRHLAGVACARTRDYSAAITHYRAAVEHSNSPTGRLHLLLGEALRNAGRHDEAAPELSRAAELGETSAPMALVQNLILAKRYGDAETAARALAERNPADPQAAVCLATAVHSQGRPEEALEWYRRAAALDPRDHRIASGLAMASNYASGVPAAEVRRLHEAYGRIAEVSLAAHPKPMHRFGPGPRRALAPGERLRLGVLSPDFRGHAVSCFLEPALASLDPARVEVYCYSVSSKEDAATERYRALAGDGRRFTQVGRMNGVDVARAIAAHGVHVLIDAAGHTENSRLPVLELRPAPVQALYLGYPATTGMRAVDARITDSLADPPGSEPYSVERLVRLDPCHLVYRPPPNAPRPRAAPPAIESGTITFGSFSTVLKLSAETIDTWSRLLRETPRSRLLLKHDTLRDPRTRESLARRFAAARVEPDRLVIEPPADGPEGLLPHYARVDIALDTFPYCGTTTVCEALLMGVPVIARPGPTTASRTSLSVLTAARVPELAAPNSDEFVRIAASLARDHARLSSLRTSLPAAFTASPLRDEAGFGVRFADALRALWANAGDRS